jgi:hypothetical protein
MISGDHDPDLGSWFTLGLAGLAVAASAQVVVPDICQFGALEDPEDRPPSVVDTMLSRHLHRKDPGACHDHFAYVDNKCYVAGAFG